MDLAHIRVVIHSRGFEALTAELPRTSLYI